MIAVSLRRHALPVLLVVAVALAIAIPVFLRLSDPVHVISDIPLHARLAPRMVAQGGWISYSLWYPLLFVAAGGSSNPFALQAAAVVFLTLATVARTVVAYVIAARATGRRWVGIAGALVVLLAMPLINPLNPTDIYLGQISPNVWHNSTNILVAPFALAAFAAAVSLLRSPTVRTASVFGVLGLLVVLMKPNYMLALLPMLGVMLLWSLHVGRIAWPRRVGLIALSFLPATLMLVVQYGLVFRASVRDTSMTIAPLAVWKQFSDNIPLSILLSVAGPLVALLVLPRIARKSHDLVLAWGALAIAVLQMSVLAEAAPGGAIDLDGNFFWGSYTAMLVVFLVSVIALARAFPAWPSGAGRRVAVVVAVVLIGLHVASGLVYVLFAGVGTFPVV